MLAALPDDPEAEVACAPTVTTADSAAPTTSVTETPTNAASVTEAPAITSNASNAKSAPGTANTQTVAVVKRAPSKPTVAGLKRLFTPPDQRPLLRAAYLMPKMLVSLLDCLADAPTDAQAHLDALDLRPAWRLPVRAIDGAAAIEEAVRALAPRLRSTTQPVVLVLLFGRDRTTGVGGRRATPEARLAAEPGTVTAAEKSTFSVEVPGDTRGTPPSRDGVRGSHRPPSVRSVHTHPPRAPKVQPKEEDFLETLARPCVLLPRRGSRGGGAGGGADGGGGGGADGSSSGSLSGDDPSRAEAATVLPEDWAGESEDTFEEAARAVRFVCGGGGVPPLHSTHTLPTAGNWVRLSMAQQHVVTRKAETARRHAAAAASCATAGTQSFGTQARLSASRRWAHQTPSGRCAGSSGGLARTNAAPGGEGGATPGSFLPLKAFVSRMEPQPRAPRPGSLRQVDHLLVN